MPSPLVRTKLFVPQVRQGVVARPRLVDRLGPRSATRLTLVSAPPGFGKTTLLAAWAATAAAAGRRVAWVSLEESEQDPIAFWTYVVTAVDTVAPGVGRGALLLLQQRDPLLRTVVTMVLNELSTLADGLDLVLDDYHLADTPGVTADVGFLVEHLPAQAHVLVSTRADPAVSLPRLRARGELVEVRAADLRFTMDEVAAYLNEVMGLGLVASDVAALEGRTEGWIAALQLAALSLQDRQDVGGFIAGFAGDDRYVVDYLVEEVLARQPEVVRRFLLDTSILERLSARLCDAVTGGSDSRGVLESLDRSNLFVVALDDSRHWYRYHHLFAEVLRAHLVDERSDVVATLHGRAARWFAANDEPVPAVRHALAAGDVEQAADVMERSVVGMLRDRQETAVRRWIDDVPDDVVRRRPVLAVGFIGALMSSGQQESVESRLDDVELVLAGPAQHRAALEESELARLPAAVQTYRAALALVRGDPVATVEHADVAIARAMPGDDLTVASAAALSGLARWTGGDLEAAHREYSVAIEGLRRTGNYSDVLGCSIAAADIRLTQGRLGDARRTYEEALRLAADHEVGGPLRGTVDMLVGLAQVALERGDLDTAATHLARVDELGEHNGLPQHPYRWRVARARLRAVGGDLAGAAALLEAAESVYVGDFSPNVRPVPAQRARVLLAQDRLAEALDWARAQGLAPDDELSYVHEYEHVTLARILAHQHRTTGSEPARHAAAALLERLGVAAEGGGRNGTLVEVLSLQALAHRAVPGRHDVPAARGVLERALLLAEPEGYVRVFVGEGRPMAALLAEVARTDPTWEYPQRLLDAFLGARAPSAPVPNGVVDPLTVRELEVLRLLATDLDGPGIARQLVVSLSTVRTHTKSIYAKLGVSSRRAAVSRAGELSMLSRSVR